MSTLGLELTKLINPDLTWKTVAKGYRSSSRRTRKPATRRSEMDVELSDEGTSKAGVMSVSDTEKHGVAILGHRFSEEIEHVPIKKRRIITPPPSLMTQISSTCFKVTEPNSGSKRRCRAIDTSNITKFSGMSSGANDGTCDYGEDLSGIEMLAAVACSNSLFNHVNIGEESSPREESTQGVDSSISAVPAGSSHDLSDGDKLEASLPEDSSAALFHESSISAVPARSLHDLADGDKLEVSLPEDSSAALFHESSISAVPAGSSHDLEDGVKLEASLPEDSSAALFHESSISAVPAGSSHDLEDGDKLEASLPEDSSAALFHESPTIKDTIKMEATTSLQDERLLWDLNAVPCDNLCDDSQVDVQHGISMGRGAMLQDMGNCEVLEGPKDTRKIPLDGLVPLEVHADDPSLSDLKGLPCWPCRSSIDQVEAESVLRYRDKLVSSAIGIAQEPSTSDVADVKASDEVLGTDNSSRAGISLISRGTSPSSLIVSQNIEVCSSNTQLGKFSSIKSNQIERSSVATSHLLESERVDCETGTTTLNEDGEESRVASGLHEDEKSIQDLIHPEGESGDHKCSLSNGDISASGESGVEGQYVVVEKQVNGVSGANTTRVESHEATGSEELMQKSCVESIDTSTEALKVHDSRLVGSLAKVVTEDCSDERYGLDVCQADKVDIPGAKNNVELQAGYDSQFEDGELREYESIYYWDKNEGKGEDVEHVDYGSECEEETLCGFGGKEIRVERGSSLGSGDASRRIESCGTGDAVRDDSVSPRTRTSDLTAGKVFPSVVVTGSSASDGELRSCVKGPDANPQKDAIITGRADSSHNLHSQDAREATSKKLRGRDSVASHMRGRSLGDRHSVNPSPGYWESGREYLPCSSIPTRPKSVFRNRGYMVATENAGHEIARFTRFDHRSHKQFYNSDSHTGYPCKMRRRLPVTRDYGYDIHATRLAVREVSPTRNHYRRSQKGFGRGFREEYHRHTRLENIGYPKHISHRLARRKRSISPLGRVRPHYAMAYRKSQSRSRSRSPTAYSRLRSSSPNFRSETRMERPRFSYDKHFSVGYEEGLCSPARSNFSPQHNSRWFDYRNSASDGYRERKPTVRMFRQGQRFETVDPIWRFETVYPPRLSSDEEFSPMTHSRKFSNVEVTVREGEYEGSDCDRKKRSSRFEAVHRARHYDTDEAVEWSQLQSSGFFCDQGLS